MTPRTCLACGQALPSWVRIDKLTCTGACRTRLCRQRNDARNTLVTGRTAVTTRSGRGWTIEPVGHLSNVRARPIEAGQLDLWEASESESYRAAGAR
jgi:predicted nucleic acid-binding Zn ribbon protein